MKEAILIVDDEYLARNHLKACIKEYMDDINILEAATGREALEISIVAHPRIIFLDITLPDLNGLIVAQQIMKSVSETNLYFLTAYDYFSYAQEAIKIGARQFLLKPITKQQIKEIISEYLVSKESVLRNELPEPHLAYEKTRMLGQLESLEREFLNLLKLKDYSSARQKLDKINQSLFSGNYSFDQIRMYLSELSSLFNRTTAAMYPSISEELSIKISIFWDTTVQSSHELSDLFGSEINGIFTRMVFYKNKAIQDNDDMKQKLILFLNAHFTYDLTLNDLADALDANPTYISTKFKNWIGESFSDYMKSKRLSLAKHLLIYSNDTLQEISEKTGYGNANYFCRIFNKSVGLSPGRYRTQNTVHFD